MSKNRTINKMLALLTNKEQEQFNYYLKNSINSKQIKIHSLYECLIKKHSIAKTWSILFPESEIPDDPFSTSVYRKLEFQLNSHLESFLSIQAFLEDKLARELFLIKALNKRKAGKLFEKKLKKAKARIDKDSVRDEYYYKFQYQLERQNQHYLQKQLLKSKGSIAPRITQSFDTWWLHEKFKLAIANLIHEQITGIQVPDPYFEDILAYARNLSEDEYPVLYVYRVLCETLSTGLTNEDLHTMIYARRKSFSIDALKDVFSTVMSFYAKLANTGNHKDFLKKLFELYKWGIVDRLVFNDNQLPWVHYKNVTTLGITLKEYVFTHDFIEKYKVYIPKDHREEAYRFSLALYHFSQKEFKQVIRLLNVKFSNISYEIQARMLVLQSHYEQGSDEDLTRSLRSIRIFIGRQKEISEHRKISQINRIKSFEKLVKAYSKKNYTDLLEKITNEKVISNRQWLIEKVKEKIM